LNQNWTLATILIRNGSLKVGDEVVVENFKGKIKAMLSDRGENLKIAGPSQAVEVLGFSGVPPVGAKVEIVIGGRQDFSSPKPEIKPEVSSKAEKQLKVILKADTQGTLEAISGSLAEEIRVIFGGVGNINESDVLLARTTNAELVGFNVKAPQAVKKLAESEGIKIKTYKVIYELLGDLEKRVLKILEPTIDEEILGLAEIVAEFVVKKQRVAGCRVKEGRISKQSPLHLRRGEKILGDCQIISMKTGKTDIDKAKKGEEFGAVFSTQIDFKIGDMLISFKKLPQ